MANEVLVKTGTTKTWKASAGDYAITLASLAAAAARQGVKGDLGATHAARYAVRCTFNMNAAPTNGGPIEIYWSSSTSGTAATDNTGAASGADAAYTGSAGGGIAYTKLQLQLIGIMAATADSDGVVQRAEFVFSPTQRYGMPIIINNTSAAFEGDDDSHAIVLVPLIDEVQ